MALLLLPSSCCCSLSIRIRNRSGRFDSINRTTRHEVQVATSSSSSLPLSHRRRRFQLAATASQLGDGDGEGEEEEEEVRGGRQRGRGDYVTLIACAVGLFTGLAVVLFNYAVSSSLPLLILHLFAMFYCGVGGCNWQPNEM